MERAVLEYRSGDIAAKLGRGYKSIVHGVSFEVRRSESLAIVGETGSGKTMTALSILRLLPDNVIMQGGSVVFNGQNILTGRNMGDILGTKIVYIPQSGSESLAPSRSVRRQMYDSLEKMNVPRREMASAALEKLRVAGFEEPEKVIDMYPFQLSGGMAQRVTIAISACSDADLIIADEPTNGLDSDGRRRFMDMLGDVFPNAARIIITHDMGVAKMCDRILVLLSGCMMEKGSALNVLGAPHHPYTRALIGSLVENGMLETPKLRNRKGNCPFFTRCKYADAECNGDMKHREENGSEWWCCH